MSTKAAAIISVKFLPVHWGRDVRFRLPMGKCAHTETRLRVAPITIDFRDGGNDASDPWEGRSDSGPTCTGNTEIRFRDWPPPAEAA